MAGVGNYQGLQPPMVGAKPLQMESERPHAALLRVGAAALDVKVVDKAKAPLVLVPDGYKVQYVELEDQPPKRKEGKHTILSAASFISFYAKHAVEGCTEIYGIRGDRPAFSAVFDDHSATGPGWRRFQAHYECPLAREWTVWTGNNGQAKAKGQEAFAEFLENNQLDVFEPNGAVMLEIAKQLEAKKNVNYESGIRLSDGQIQYRYEEQIQGSAAKGTMTIPENFSLAIPVFDGGPRYQIEARFRYRINSDRKLVLWYDLVRPHKVIEDAAQEVWALIEEGCGTKILHAEV